MKLFSISRLRVYWPEGSVPKMIAKCAHCQMRLLRMVTPLTLPMPMQSMCAPDVNLRKSWMSIPSKRMSVAGSEDW